MKTQLLSTLFLTLLLITGCEEKKASQDVGAVPVAIEGLLALYENVNIDTLAVTSAYPDNEGDDFPYKGKKIDSAFLSFFPQSIQELPEAEKELYACYKFKIDEQHVGLITRTPSEYVPSSIKLLVYHTQQHTMTNAFELAESFGDAGDAMTKDSWLYRTKQGHIKWFYWRQDCSYDIENDSLAAPEPECWDSMAVYTLQEGNVVDTKLDSLTLRHLKNKFSKK